MTDSGASEGSALVQDESVFRLAIVGGGPRSLFAVERLWLNRLRERSTTSGFDSPELRIDVISAHPAFGAGPNYDPALPDCLRLNFATRHVDAFSADAPASVRQSLVSWLREHAPEWAEPDGFVPRARVGEYLQEAWRQVLLEARSVGLRIETHRATVDRLEVSPDGTRMRSNTGESTEVYDEVLVTIGHGSGRRDDFVATWNQQIPTLGAVLSAEGRARLTAGRAGTTVAIRGFALTCLDAMLLLTEGRGGRFVDEPPEGSLGRLRYVPSGAEPATILPFSRSGLPLLAKPGPSLTLPPEARDRVEAGRDRLRSTAPERFGERAIRRVLLDTAVGCLAAQGVAQDLATVERAFDVAFGLGTPSDPIERMRTSVEVAFGRLAPDAAWALGESWRQLYPVLVERVGYGGLPEAERPAFDRLARAMERLAFGPPPQTVAKMLALEAAGLLDLRALRSHLEATEAGVGLVASKPRQPGAETRRAIDLVVDAVLARPGVDEEAPLFGALLAAGQARCAPGTAGLETTRSAQAVDAEGRPVPGLSIVGRAAEGWVLGHDTLSRSLHSELDRWAIRCLETARSSEPLGSTA